MEEEGGGAAICVLWLWPDSYTLSSGFKNFIYLFILPQVASVDERSPNQGTHSPRSGSPQNSPRRVRSETMFLERAVPLLRRMKHSQSMALEKRLLPEPKPTLERFLET